MMQHDTLRPVEDGILLASFGTSYEDTRRETIEALKDDVRAHWPQYELYEAFTSGMIRRKLLLTKDEKIFSVKQALEAMHEAGIRRVTILATQILPAIEYEIVVRDAQKCADLFETIRITTALLADNHDVLALADILSKDILPAKQAHHAVIFMGHGSDHEKDIRNEELESALRELGRDDAWIATVEGRRELEHLIPLLKSAEITHVHLIPLMLVAGDHAHNDMAGDEEDSWKTILEQHGYEVSCSLKGLGSYPAIRTLYINKAECALADCTK